jgi:molybdenum-dependent DNA-binding transcriptional regulator ModE
MTKTFVIQATMTTAQIKAKAKEIGIPYKELKNMLQYATSLHADADELGLTPPQQVSALVTAIGDIITRCYDKSDHQVLASDVVDQIWSVCQLTHNTSEQGDDSATH